MKKTFRIVCIAIYAILLLGSLSACSKDDDDKLPPTPPEILGTWSGSYTDEDGDGVKVTMTFNENHTGVYNEIDSSNDSYTLPFQYTVTGDITNFSIAELHYWGTDNYGDKEDVRVKISVTGNTMRLYAEDETITLYKGSAPIPDNPSDKGRDELSNTSWKLQSITGFASSESSEWKGEILKFGNNGQVTQIYNEGGSGSGTYSLSGNLITFSSLPAWTNSWGSKFTYTLSGSTLKLKDSNDNLGSTFNFVKE